MKNTFIQKYNIYLAVYLSFLMIMSFLFLEIKHDVGNDSTISEWLINYSGGFTKRGIIGQTSIFFSRIFNLELRDTILYFQIIVICIYFVSIYLFLKNILIERLYLLAVFTPIFLLYPVSEIEVLARKEIFIYILFLLHLFVLLNYSQFSYLSKLLTFTLSILIWEPIIFFLPLWILIDLSMFINKQNYKLFLKVLIPYIPGVLICIIYIVDPLSAEEHFKMAKVLSNEFGEICYMSCGLLLSKSTLTQQFTGNFHAYSFINIFRYVFIIIIGFSPLFFLMFFSKFKKKFNIFNYLNQNLVNIFFIILSPIILLFLMAYDWGRWVNITYTMTFITFLFLFKKKVISINFHKLNNCIINKLSRKNFILLFFVFCYTWAPKTTITGDIGSLPLYRAFYKLLKIYLIN